MNWKKSIRIGRPERIKANHFCSVYYFCDKYPATIRPMGVSSKAEVCGNLCQCQANYDNKSSKASSDNLFSPIKNKMKVLKKIKKRMGLGRLSSALFMLINNRRRPEIPWMNSSWEEGTAARKLQRFNHDSSIKAPLFGWRCASWEREHFPMDLCCLPPKSRCILLSVLFTHLVWTKSREKKKHSDFKKPIWVFPRCADENEKN